MSDQVGAVGVGPPEAGDWRARTKRFYGWWLIGALFVILFFMGGGGFYIFPVFIESFRADFGWTMEQISWSAGIFAIVFGLSGPFIGTLIAKIGARKTMLIAASAAGFVNLAYALMNSLWMLYAIALVGGFVMAGTTLVPSQTLVTTWFEKYRGRAMALSLLGIGFGGMLLPPWNEFVIRWLGWRAAWAWGAAFVWILVIPLIAVFVRTRPQELGLLPDGAARAETVDGATEEGLRGVSVGRAVKTVAFPLLVGIYLTQLIGQSIINFHFVPFAIREGGFSPPQAAWFLGLGIGFSVVGKVLFGWAADRWSPAVLMGICGFLAALGPLALWFFIVSSGSSSTAVLWLHAVPYGIGYGGQIILLPVLVGRCFGPLNFGKIQGLVMSGFAVGILVGIPLAGRIFDKTSSYEIALVLTVVVFVASGVFSLLVRPDRYQAEFVSG
jgi:MFS family permease